MTLLVDKQLNALETLVAVTIKWLSSLKRLQIIDDFQFAVTYSRFATMHI